MIILLTCMLIGENQFICLISQPDYRDWIPQFGNWHSPLSQSVYHSKKTNTLLKITFILIMTNTHVPKRYIWGGGGGGGGGQMKRRHRKTKTDHWHASRMKKEDHFEGRHERVERGVTSARQQHSIPCTKTLAHLKRANNSLFLRPQAKFLLMATLRVSYGHSPRLLLMATLHISYGHSTNLFLMTTIQIYYGHSPCFLWPHFTFLSYGHSPHFLWPGLYIYMNNRLLWKQIPQSNSI